MSGRDISGAGEGGVARRKRACPGKRCICGDANLKMELICINSAVCEKSSGMRKMPDGHLLLWKCLFCCRITMLQFNSCGMENGNLIQLAGFGAGAAEAKVVRRVGLI